MGEGKQKGAGRQAPANYVWCLLAINLAQDRSKKPPPYSQWSADERSEPAIVQYMQCTQQYADGKKERRHTRHAELRQRRLTLSMHSCDRRTCWDIFLLSSWNSGRPLVALAICSKDICWDGTKKKNTYIFTYMHTRTINKRRLEKGTYRCRASNANQSPALYPNKRRQKHKTEFPHQKLWDMLNTCRGRGTKNVLQTTTAVAC